MSVDTNVLPSSSIAPIAPVPTTRATQIAGIADACVIVTVRASVRERDAFVLEAEAFELRGGLTFVAPLSTDALTAIVQSMESCETLNPPTPRRTRHKAANANEAVKALRQLGENLATPWRHGEPQPGDRACLTFDPRLPTWARQRIERALVVEDLTRIRNTILRYERACVATTNIRIVLEFTPDDDHVTFDFPDPDTSTWPPCPVGREELHLIEHEPYVVLPSGKWEQGTSAFAARALARATEAFSTGMRIEPDPENVAAIDARLTALAASIQKIGFAGVDDSTARNQLEAFRRRVATVEHDRGLISARIAEVEAGCAKATRLQLRVQAPEGSGTDANLDRVVLIPSAGRWPKLSADERATARRCRLTVPADAWPGSGPERLARTRLAGRAASFERDTIVLRETLPADAAPRLEALREALALARELEADGMHVEWHPESAARFQALEDGEKVVHGPIADLVRWLRAHGHHPLGLQIDGAKFLLAHRAALLADEPGLGKTWTLLLALRAHQPSIVVTPSAEISALWREAIAIVRPDLHCIGAPKIRRKRAREKSAEKADEITTSGAHFAWPGDGEVLVVEITRIPAPPEPPDDEPPKAEKIDMLNREARATYERAKRHHEEHIRTYEAERIEYRRWINRLERKTTLAVDEAHTAKDPTTKNARRLRAIAERLIGANSIPSDGRLFRHEDCGRVFLISATPFLNAPRELYDLLANLSFFVVHSDRPPDFDRKRINGIFEDPERTPQIVRWLRSFMIRREKKQVMPWLGKKYVEHVYDLPDPKNRKTLDDILRKIAERLKRQKKMPLEEIATLLERLRGGYLANAKELRAEMRRLPRLEEFTAASMLLSEMKLPPCHELLDDLERDGEKVVLFSRFVPPLEAVIQSRKGWLGIHGKVSSKKRRAACEQFEHDPALNGVACTYRTGGVGITLTAANQAVMIDRWWNPGINQQAEDRVHRFGQQRSPVQIHLLKIRHAIEEHMSGILEIKERYAAMLAASCREAAGLTEDEMAKLFRHVADDSDILPAPAPSVQPAPATNEQTNEAAAKQREEGVAGHGDEST